MTTTLTNLRDALRQRTDTVASTYVTDTELEGYLNSSLAELYDVLVMEFEDYNITSTTGTVSSTSTPYFALPSDFHKCRGVDRTYSSTQSVSLFPYEFIQRNAYAYPFPMTPYGFVDVRYRIQGSNCMLLPAANSVGTYTLWYVPRFSVLASGGTLPTYMDENAWHEYAVADSAIKVLAKQDLDPSTFMQQKEALRQRIIQAAKPRDAGMPKRAINTRMRRQAWRWGFGGGFGWGGQ